MYKAEDIAYLMRIRRIKLLSIVYLDIMLHNGSISSNTS